MKQAGREGRWPIMWDQEARLLAMPNQELDPQALMTAMTHSPEQQHSRSPLAAEWILFLL